MKIVFEPELTSSERNRVELGVDLHNVAVTQLPEFYNVAFVVRENSGEIRGGLLGQVWAGWLHISYLWVDKPLRHHQWATKLMRAAERYALDHGAHSAHVETFSFQARPLYEKLGYTVFATLEDFPPGHCKYFLKRKLTTKRNGGARKR